MYEGDWINNKREGYGIYYQKNGEYYKGHWKSGLTYGEGELYNKNGKNSYILVNGLTMKLMETEDLI